MRKTLFLILLMMLVLLTAAAAAETLNLPDVYATVEIPSDFTVILRPGQTDRYAEWLAAHNLDADELEADWAARGVAAQCWTKDDSVCLEITAVQDDYARQYFDTDQVETALRTAYRKAHTSGAIDSARGYLYTSAEWKNETKNGRFLFLKYKRTSGASAGGYIRRTIRNGYTITLDWQVYGRSATSKDSSALDKVLKDFRFNGVKDRPADAAVKTTFTEQPPLETNTGKFSVSGKAEAGARLTAVLLRMSSPDPVTMNATAGKTGKFDFDVVLPKEGVWLMTMTVEMNGTVTEDIVFEPTVYQKNLLTVNLDGLEVNLSETHAENEEVQVITGDSLTVSGTTLKGTRVQCISSRGYQKIVTTNNTGRFSFKVDTSAEGDIEIILTFQKKGYDNRRYTVNATREISAAQMKQRIRSEAVKPAYSTLTSKLTGYTGRVMVYTLYCTGVERSGNTWYMLMAMKKSKTGEYSNYCMYTAEEDPGMTVGQQYKVYGRCTGPHELEQNEKTVMIPAFDYLFRD